MTLLRMIFPTFTLSVDRDGLPIVNYGGRLGRRVFSAYNPVTMGIIGLKAKQSTSLVGLPDFDETGNEVLSRVSVDAVAQWLFDASVDKGEFMVFHYNFPYNSYRLNPPWRSSLAEAFAGMFLVIHGNTTGDNRYLQHGVKHLKSMMVPISKGGLKLDDSNTFLEYVDYENNRGWPIVLNGHLYSMVTLFNAWKILGVPEFRFAFNQALSELKDLLPAFDGGFFSYYDNYGNPATPFYHRIHIHLLDYLYALSKAQYLRTMAERWRSHMGESNFALSLFMRLLNFQIPYLPRK